MGDDMKDLKRRFPLYSLFLGLFPKEYRIRYEDEMLQVTADMLDAAPDAPARALIWLKLFVDVPAGIIAQQLNVATGPLTQQTPRYIMLASMLSSLLLLPFFVILAINTTDQLVFGHSLYNSWLWHMPQLGIWVLQLPLAALIIAAVCYVAYVLAGPDRGKLHWWQRATDVRRAWPVILPILVGCGVLFLFFFHDSVHCWTHVPTYMFTHLSSEVRCTQISG